MEIFGLTIPGWVLWVVLIPVLLLFSKLILGWVFVPNGKLALLEKTWSLKGDLPQGMLVATNGEAGYQAELLTSGLKFFYWRWMYKISFIDPVIVPDFQLGLITAKFGQSVDPAIGLGKVVPCNDFQDITAFLTGGGEMGPQMAYLRPGTYGINPKMFEHNFIRAEVIDEGHIGAVEAQFGQALGAGSILGKEVECSSFQDITAFHANGGQRGPQRAYLNPGTYFINTFMFKIEEHPMIVVGPEEIGVVTTNDGDTLDEGDIAGPVIEGHRSFQLVEEFMQNHGRRGLQEQVLMPGEWRINPYFAKVEKAQMTFVPIGTVCVVTKFTGQIGEDQSGEEFKHGTIVKNGFRGVQMDPLNPGKYPLNPMTCKYEIVPTTNIVLNWADAKTESHKLDENLSTIKARTKDGFQMSADVAQILNISYTHASKVIARFGTLKNLISQVLEPTIGNYFRNSIQEAEAMEFIQQRTKRQQEAKVAINRVLTEYNVVGVDTLIGDVVPPEQLLKPLQEQHIAERMKLTYKVQKEAADQRKEFEKSNSEADMQPEVVKSEREIQIADNHSQAVVKRQEGDSKAIELKAGADANATKIKADADAEAKLKVGSAEAEVIEKVGTATASAYKQQVEAMGQDGFTSLQVAKELANGKVQLVPQIVGGGNGSSTDGLLGLLTLDKLGVKLPGNQSQTDIPRTESTKKISDSDTKNS